MILLNEKTSVKIRFYLTCSDHEGAAVVLIQNEVDPNVGSRGKDTALILAISERLSSNIFGKQSELNQEKSFCNSPIEWQGIKDRVAYISRFAPLRNTFPVLRLNRPRIQVLLLISAIQFY